MGASGHMVQLLARPRCALEGALLLVLFSTAAFVEMRLTGHAKGDLKSLWATVPGEATVVDVDAIGAPVTGSEKLVPARDVTVGTHVFVKSGQQVRFFLFGFSTRHDFFAKTFTLPKIIHTPNADDDTIAETS